MKIGANDISAVKIGATDVNKVYLGSNLVWEKAGATLLLDLYPNAAAAYSLRKLRTAYAGASIKVRRSSDNTEQDIGFVDNELDTTSLLSFVGAGDGFVTTWYDQSGNGYDALQVSDANQPRIVSLGVIDTINNKPALYLDGTKVMQTTSTNISVADGNGNRSAFGTLNISQANENSTLLVSYLDGGANLWWPIGYSIPNNGLFVVLAPGLADVVPYTLNSNSIVSSIVSNSKFEIWNNNVSDGSTAHGITASGGTKISLFARNSGSLLMNGYSNEIILYPSDQSANRVGIESNINEYHNIYWDGSQTGLLDDYPNASAAYSLRALNSSYTGAAIRVRRSSDNEEQDINLLYDGSLNTDSLLSFVGAGDGFVTTWYDQSGGGSNDSVQGSASKQPKIVSSGSVINENGKISVKFNGTTDYIENQLSVGPTVTAFAVSKIVDELDFNFIYDSFGTGGRIRLGLRNNKEYFADNAEASFAEAITASNGLQNLFFAKHTNSDVSISVNQDTLQTIASTNFYANTQYWVIGARNDGADHFLEGTIQELILYPSDQSANRVGIETNINNHYTIY